MTQNSADFVDVAQNRDSLRPTTFQYDLESLVHRAVVASGTAAVEFSAARGHPVYPVRLPTRSVSFSVGELDAGARTSRHRHAYESAIFVLSGSGHSLVESHEIHWKAGDALYVPPWSWHEHIASDDGKASYLTATNLPMLVQLGQTVLREEER